MKIEATSIPAYIILSSDLLSLIPNVKLLIPDSFISLLIEVLLRINQVNITDSTYSMLMAYDMIWAFLFFF